MVQSTESFKSLAPDHLKAWLHDAREIALIDVREAGEYGENHLFYAINVPYSRLEKDIVRLAPNPLVRLVIVDEDGAELAKKAAQRLCALGYKQVYVLDGGNRAWRKSGRELFAGVNVPSKAFGEMAEHFFETPRIEATELRAKQIAGEDLVVLDGRPFNEYQKMSIPGAICCPNGELALRVPELIKSQSTTIVINCAGRTRSIIGAQTLRNLGLSNPIYALENGTQGWFLADFELEHGAQRRHGLDGPAETLEASRQRAQKLAWSYKIQTIQSKTLMDWWHEKDRTTYLCDVRTPEEFARSHLPGASSTPGGQLIQATDQYVAVRGARLVLWDGDGVRAPVIAHWLAQMGWEVAVLDYQTQPSEITTPPVNVSLSACKAKILDPKGMQTIYDQDALIVDIRTSAAYRATHLKKALWCSRRDLSRKLEGVANSTPIVIVSDDEVEARLAANDLMASGRLSTHYFPNFSATTGALGLECVSTPELPPDNERIDYLFFVHDRHDGNKAAARQYLAWEINLLNQLDDRESGAYRLSRPA
jgi:rhodanese-related sulfurtransferase